MALGGIIGGIFSGGLLGGLGAIGTGVLDFFKQKERNKQELAVITAQKELALVNANSATLLETLKLTGASYENDKATYGKDVGFIDIMRGTLRPVVTYLLVGVSIGLSIWAFRRVELGAEVITEIAKYGIYTCLDLTAMCVSWWFGSRQIDKIRRK